MDKCLFISRSAIEHNVDYYIKNTQKHFIAVVKNNAYGHGLKEVLSILENKEIKMYAVSNLKEANEANKYTNRDILILDKLDNYDNLKDNYVITVISKKHLKQLVRLKKRIRIHLKINIAMKRKGIEVDELDECLNIIKDSELILEGVYTHYSTYKLRTLKKEFNKFKAVLDKIDNKHILIHASSSVSSFTLEENITNAIRIGVGMYGLKKLDNKMTPLKIASELKCESKNSYSIQKFDRFSYNNRYIGKKGFIIMANIGYGDGLFFKNKIRGYVETDYIKEIGNRNMDNIYFYSKDYIMEGSLIEIYGKHNRVDNIAKKYKIPVCKILALMNENIDKEIVD